MVDNSRKASQEGDVIYLRAYEDGENAVLEVQDFGYGIPEEDLQKITEAFYMVDKSRSRESGGAGLGLALTDRILRKNGGKLEIFSKLGRGTTMKVSFPAMVRYRWQEEVLWDEAEGEEEEGAWEVEDV